MRKCVDKQTTNNLGQMYPIIIFLFGSIFFPRKSILCTKVFRILMKKNIILYALVQLIVFFPFLGISDLKCYSQII